MFFSICSHLDKEKKHICHRDYHSRNLMIHNEKIYVIDFQDTRLGAVQYDLVSLLEDVYVDLDEEVKKRLLYYYWNMYSKRETPSGNFESFLQVYDLQLLQRLFKVCATFSGFYLFKKDNRYTKYISIAAKKISKTLKNFPQYKILKEVALKFQTRYAPK